MSETMEDLRNENFRLKLRKGSYWPANEIKVAWRHNENLSKDISS